MTIFSSLLIYLIRTLRFPLFGPGNCRFYPSCTEFACQQLKKKPLHLAFIAIIKQLGSCHPWGK